MIRRSSRRIALLGAGGITLLAVVCSAISTFAWFTTSHNPDQAADIVSGSSSLNLGAVTAYRDGYDPYTGVAPSEDGDNDGSTKQDYSFDIPTDGVGYYLVPEYDGAYKYANTGTVKLDQYSSSTVAMKSSVSLTSGKHYQFRKYTFENNKTVNKHVTLSGEKKGNLTVSADGLYITVTSTNTYSVWLDYERGEVGLEIVTPFTQKNLSSAEKGYMDGLASPKKATNYNEYPSIADGKKRIFLTNWFSNNPKIYWWGGGSTSPSWDGRPGMDYLYTNSYSQDVFYYDIPSAATYVKFTDQNDTANSGDVQLSGNNAFYKGSKVEGFKITDVTYYFYNFLDKDRFFSNTPKAYGQISHTWYGDVTSTNICRTSTTANMSGGTDNIWSVTVPSFMTELVITGTHGSSTTLTIGCEGEGEHYYVLSSASSGSWYESISQPSGEPVTYYFYDYSNIFSSGHKCYYWKEGSAGIIVHPAWPGVDMSEGSTSRLYSVSIPSDFDTVIFGDGGTGGSHQTENVTLDPSRRYYVIDGRQNNDGTYQVMSFVQVGGISSTPNTYFVFDPSGKLGGSAPSAYAFIQTDIESDDYYYKTPRDTFFITNDGEVRNGSWPGAQTSAGQIESTSVAGLYTISVSSSFTHIIFSNGASADSASLIKTTDDAAELVDGNPYFVVGNETSSGSKRYGGIWTDQIGVVTLKTKYSLYDSGSDTPMSFASKTIATETISDTSAVYTPSTAVADEYVKDGTNGIYYHFEPERDGSNNIVWYDEDGNSYSPAVFSTAFASSLVTLYANMRCVVSNMSTFYVDVGHSGIVEANRWQNINLHAWGSDFDSKSGNNYWSDFQIGTQVAPNIYKLTVPNTVTGFQIINHGIEYANKNNQTSDISLVGKTDLLTVHRPADAESVSSTSWSSVINTAFGTATIKVYRQSNGSLLCSQAMHTGDGAANNYFIYEEGINLEEDAYICIEVVSSVIFGDENTHYLKYDNLVKEEGGKAEEYLSERAEYGDINITGGTRRYTFYINHDATNTSTDPQRECVAIPQVPYYGNGYYIMPTTDHGKVTGFNDFTKMTSVGENSAVFRGYSVDASETNPTYIYFRSYIDGVDTLYTDFEKSRMPSSIEVQSKTIEGVSTECILKFTGSGKFTIRITGKYVSVVNYEVDNYFYLDPPIGTGTIYNQMTAIVLKVPFKTRNSEQVHIELELHGPSFLGAYLFVATEAEVLTPANNLDDDNVFATMRNKASAGTGGTADSRYVTTLSSATAKISTKAIAPNEATVQYYAFILVDFVTKSVPSIPSSAMSFYLKSVQG